MWGHYGNLGGGNLAPCGILNSLFREKWRIRRAEQGEAIPSLVPLFPPLVFKNLAFSLKTPSFSTLRETTRKVIFFSIFLSIYSAQKAIFLGYPSARISYCSLRPDKDHFFFTPKPFIYHFPSIPTCQKSSIDLPVFSKSHTMK